jgi:hypothetical protein
MKPPHPEMVRRVAATQATVARFQGLTFRWGQEDCARMVVFHLRQMGRPIAMAKAGSYSNALGAARAMRRFGVVSLIEALDKHGLEQIPPAAAVAGDIVAMPSADSFDALAIALGNGRVLGYHDDADGAAVLQPVQFITAWRVVA